MDFQLDKKHELARELFHQIAEKEVKPLAREMDEQERINVDMLRKLFSLGLGRIAFPKEIGGEGGDFLMNVLAIEELAKADASTAACFSVHASLFAPIMVKYGSEELKKELLPDIISCKKLGCFGLTEANAGSDAAGVQTTAVLDGDYYIVNGSKMFITSPEFSDYFMIVAITDQTKGTKGGASVLLLERGMEGFTIGAPIPRMGMRAISNCPLTFDNVRVPKKNLIGREGDGIKIALGTLDPGRVNVAAQAVGVAEAAFQEARQYVKERKQFGKPIAAFQNTQFKLAELRTMIDAGRLMAYKAACTIDAGKPCGVDAAEAKLYCAQMANKVTHDCVQLMGGYGYSREYPVERMMRDSKLLEIYEGTNEVMKMVIAGSLKLK